VAGQFFSHSGGRKRVLVWPLACFISTAQTYPQARDYEFLGKKVIFNHTEKAEMKHYAMLILQYSPIIIKKCCGIILYFFTKMF
jgi:hypothetical protein